MASWARKARIPFGAEGTRAEVELLHVRDVGLFRLGAGRSFLIETAWQPRETFLAQDLVDRNRTDSERLVLQGSADIVNGEILFAQGDDALAELVTLLLLLDGVGG